MTRTELIKKEFSLDKEVREYESESNNSMADLAREKLRAVQCNLYGWRRVFDIYFKDIIDDKEIKKAKFTSNFDDRIFPTPGAEVDFKAKDLMRADDKLEYEMAADFVYEADPLLAYMHTNWSSILNKALHQ
jgi:hypothetical protein